MWNKITEYIDKKTKDWYEYTIHWDLYIFILTSYWWPAGINVVIYDNNIWEEIYHLQFDWWFWAFLYDEKMKQIKEFIN